ncbi:MAG: sulfatase-like hydrolase/transferase [Oscillospiraceae bacterium]|nr:sulfatase-like hydrolase/transferase [Oscillospiraceae bacterium]
MKNILFLFSDQQRWDTLGCYNPAVDFTPNIDKLAQEGVKFENAFTCQPVCGPARACLQTGLFATQIGCYRNDIPLPKSAATIAQRFSQKGYDTAYAGKWHLASTGTKPVPPEDRGGYKDFWLAADVLEFTSDGYGGHMFDGDGKKVYFDGFRADCQTDFVIDYLKKREKDKPFFMFVSYLEPHHQNNAGHYQGPHGSKERFKNYEIPKDLTSFSGGDWREEYPDYLGCCANLDENLGRIVEALRELGEYENTIIVYTSDHGSHFKTRNREYKRSCHDSSIRVPLIIKGESFKGGKVVEELVSLIDLPVTLLKCGGAEIPREIQGRPLQDLISGECKDWRDEVFVQISESQVGRAIRTKKWKYSISAPLRSGWFHSNAKVYREEFLYDLEGDPHERNNLINHRDYEETRQLLRERLVENMVRAGEKAPVIFSGRWHKFPA